MGTVANGAVLQGREFPFDIGRIGLQEFQAQRATMLGKCAACHPNRRVAKVLERADRVKAEADASLSEMAEIIRSLEREGVLTHSTAFFSPSSQSGHIVLGGKQILKGSSRAERVFFDAFKVYHPLMWKAAYHNAPTQIIEARRELDRLHAELKDEAAALRSARSAQIKGRGK